MFASILCPIDFSKGSDHALEAAIAWAEQQNASLELLHVLEPPSYTFPGDVTGLAAELYVGLFHDLERSMAARVTEVRRRLPRVTGSVVRGQPYAEIVARAQNVDLVVLGTSGVGAIARLLLGSVADRVLRVCTRPILLVPAERASAGALPKVIVAPTDFSLGARIAVGRTAALAAEIGARVELVHAFEVPAVIARDAELATALRAAMPGEVAEVHEAAAEPHVFCHTREGAPAPTILALAEETHADLIALASTGRGLVSSMLGGVTDRVVRTAGLPILVFRASAS